MLPSPPPAPLTAALLAGLLSVAAAAVPGAAPAAATTLPHIQRLERLINAAGTLTLLSDDCPADHAGFFESGGPAGRGRIVLCANSVDLADPGAVWHVLAHEATHVMQNCTGATAIADRWIGRTYRELRLKAPQQIWLLSEGYADADRRLEAEAFWMELQSPELVVEAFRRHCAARLPPDQR
ncbi:MAG: hypothetical protein VKI83_12060 [Synechococcaceae cyanobacterium]|nr:hypothetical protein [Synechococcaceae cyanobacterium]